MAFWKRKRSKEHRGGGPLSKKTELENRKIEAAIAQIKRDKEIDQTIHAGMVEVLKQGPDSEIYKELVKSRYKLEVSEIPKKTVEDRIFEEEIVKDPEYRAAVKAARIAALKPKGEAMARLEERIAKRAEELLAEDPTYLDAIAKQKLQQTICSASNDLMKTFMSHYKEIKDWEAEVRGKEEGQGRDNFSGQIAAAIITNLPAVLAAFMGEGQQMQRLPVDHGTEVETAPTEAATPPSRTEAVAEEPPVECKVAPPATRPEEQTLSISAWMEYLEKDPVEFVDALEVKVKKEGNAGAAFAVQFLLQYDDADNLLGFLSLFESKMPADAKEALAKLKEKKQWLASVLKLVNERFRGV